MTAIESQHGRLLKAKLAEHRLSLLEALATGQDHETYTRVVGQVQGIADAVKISEQCDFELNGGQ
jgi:hypothetical protein